MSSVSEISEARSDPLTRQDGGGQGAMALDADGIGNPKALRVLFGAAVGLFGGFAIMMSLSINIFLKPISETFGWTRTEASMMPTAAFAGLTLGGPFLAWLIERFGGRTVLITGYAVLVLCLALFSIVPNSLPLVGLLCFVGGAGGAATSPPGVMLLITRAFDRHLGLAIGLMTLGMGAGTLIMPLVMAALVDPLGWRLTFLALAVLSFLFGLLAVFLVFGVVDGRPFAKDHARRAAITDVPSFRSILLTTRFWIIGTAVLVASAVGFGAMAHVPATLSDRGYTTAQAAAGAGVAGLGVTLGRLLAAILMDRIFAPLVVLVCFTVGAMGLVAVISLPPSVGPIIFLSIFLIGLIVGADGDMAPVLTRRYFGPDGFNRVFALMFLFTGIGGIFGPLIFGYLHDRFDGYAVGFDIGAGAASICGIAVLFLGRYRFEAR